MFERFTRTFFSVTNIWKIYQKIFLSHSYIYIYDQPGPSGEQKFAERKWTEMLDETGSQESGVSWLHMLNG